jgi:dihydrofolate reductase
MALKVIAAIALNGVIGNRGDIPWKIKGDQIRFKNITMGYPVVMGRKTWESIPNKFRPLPGRENIVLTSNRDEDSFKGVTIISDWSEIEKRSEAEDIFVIGGHSLYTKAMSVATDFYLTEVIGEPEGDAFFPKWSEDDWIICAEAQGEESDGVSTYPWRFRHLVRK